MVGFCGRKESTDKSYDVFFVLLSGLIVDSLICYFLDLSVNAPKNVTIDFTSSSDNSLFN